MNLKNTWNPIVAPDGRYLAYVEELENRLWYCERLQLLDFADGTTKLLLSSCFGLFPGSMIFSPDSTALIYQRHGIFHLPGRVTTSVYSCDLSKFEHGLLGTYAYERPYKKYLDLVGLE